MGNFTYSALDKGNAYMRGSVAARSVRAATVALEAQGLSVITLKRETPKTWYNRDLQFGIGLQEKILITRHLHTMMEAGMGLDQSLKTIAEQTPPKIRAVLTDIERRVQQGQPFHTALARYPDHFSPLYTNLVRVGETSGKLDDILEYLLEQQENDYRLRTKIFNAALYPTIILIALIFMVSAMLIYVIPRVQSVLEAYNVELPLQTKILLGLSYVLTHFWFLIIPAIALLFFAFRRFKRTPRGKRWIDKFILHIPGFKTLVLEVNLARLTRTLSATLKSGLPIDQALELTKTVATHSQYQEALQRSISFVRRGVTINELFRGYPTLFPPLTTRMIEVGEKTGKLDEMLSRLATFYETSVETKLTNLSSIIEPLLILVVGLVAGYVAISVMTPIWSFSQTI